MDQNSSVLKYWMPNTMTLLQTQLDVTTAAIEAKQAALARASIVTLCSMLGTELHPEAIKDPTDVEWPDVTTKIDRAKITLDLGGPLSDARAYLTDVYYLLSA